MAHKNGTGAVAEKLLIKRLKVSGLLSFGPKGIDLPMRGLNVLIGANGSGKSNLIEILGLLRATARGPLGSDSDWLWKGEGDHAVAEGTVEAVVTNPNGSRDLRHRLTLFETRLRLEVADERIEDAVAPRGKGKGGIHYDFQRGEPVLESPAGPQNRKGAIHPGLSILSQVKDAAVYPALARLESSYNQMRLFRNWQFGPTSAMRREQSLQGPNDFLLEDGGENLANVIQDLLLRVRPQLVASLKMLYDGADAINATRIGGAIQLFLGEAGGRQIRATRLSDGTLRFLSLLSILLHPQPPPLVAIEEPELGLHPDLIHHVADLLKDAATRTQLVITTHSRRLIDEFGSQPESVIVCEKEDGESSFERLDQQRMKLWLDKYSLGELWSSGQLGGNRW